MSLEEDLLSRVGYRPVAPRCESCVHRADADDGYSGWFDVCNQFGSIKNIKISPQGVCQNWSPLPPKGR